MTTVKMVLLVSIVAAISSCNSDLENQQILTSDSSNKNSVSSTSVVPVVSSTSVVPVVSSTSVVPVVSSTSVVPVVSEIRLSRSPTKEDPLRVMIIGDSTTYEIEPALSAALQKTGVVESANRTQFGFGLSQWPRYKWWEIWPSFFDQVEPEIVIFQTGIWDMDDVINGPIRQPLPTDSDWVEQFNFLMEVAVDVLSEREAHIFWLTMLPTHDNDKHERLNKLIYELADRDQRVDVIDLTPVFTDKNGKYLEEVERSGEYWPIRKIDGVHLCRFGARIAAELIIKHVSIFSDFEIISGWEEGEWLKNPRFDLDPCNDPIDLIAEKAGAISVG
ncbi:MAG TPA: hypothetical protein QGI85_05615 [Acidimicrobiales bacterium]|nr:hypothetical protein [Acidimicrobiales bacterium]